MIRTTDIPLTLHHVASISWSPSQPWHRIVNEIRQVLTSIEEDAEVEMQPNGRGEPVLYLSFPRGPLVEFPEGGILTIARDATEVLVAWASPVRRITPLGRAILASEERAQAALREETRRDVRRRVIATSIITGFAIIAYPLFVGILTLTERTLP